MASVHFNLPSQLAEGFPEAGLFFASRNGGDEVVVSVVSTLFDPSFYLGKTRAEVLTSIEENKWTIVEDHPVFAFWRQHFGFSSSISFNGIEKSFFDKLYGE